MLLPIPDREVPSAVASLQQGLTTCHLASHHLLRRLASHPTGKEALLGWISRALLSASSRALAIGSVRRYAASAERQREFSLSLSSSPADEWLCNLSATLLRLAAPFLRFQLEPPPSTLSKLPPSLYDRPSPRGRRVEYSHVSRLGGVIVAGGPEGEGEGDLWGEVSDMPEQPASDVSFVAEIFLLTQQVNVCEGAGEVLLLVERHVVYVGGGQQRGV